MDNDAFRSTYRAVNACFCPYEKGILTNNCACSQAQKFCIAEREGVQCRSAPAQATCVALLERLRREARFALKSRDTESALPHAKAMRVQIGGLRGIAACLAPDGTAPGPLDDVHALVEAAVGRFGAIDALPFAHIMQQIAAYRGREPRRRRGPGEDT